MIVIVFTVLMVLTDSGKSWSLNLEISRLEKFLKQTTVL